MDLRTYCLICLVFLGLLESGCFKDDSLGYETPPPFDRPLYDPAIDGEPLFPIKVNSRYGYMNRQGEVVIEPQYESAYDFREGIARVHNGSVSYSYLDTKGNVIWKDHDDKDSGWGGHFEDGLQVIGMYRGGEHLRAYINRKGETVIQFFFNKAQEFHEGFAAVCVHNPRIQKGDNIFSGTDEEKKRRRWGFINTRGELIAPFEYSDCYYFRDGMAAVSDQKLQEGWMKSQRYGFIDTTGKLVIPIEYDIRGVGFSEGLVGVDIDGKTGFIDKAGEMVIEPKFNGASPFSEGLSSAGIERDTWDENDNYIHDPRVGFIDKTGEFVIPPIFKYTHDFKDGLACVEDSNDMCGMIDREGNWVVPPIYEEMLYYSEGFAIVDSAGLKGYIDRNGNPITGFIFDDANSFENGLAAVTLGGNYWHPKPYTKLGYINTKGEYVWEPQY